jgi:uncharacterized membrane protein YciS (DUF1049 family)
MEQTLLAIFVGAGIAVVTVILVSVFVMVTLQRLRRPEYIHRVARKYSTSPLRLR